MGQSTQHAAVDNTPRKRVKFNSWFLTGKNV